MRTSFIGAGILSQQLQLETHGVDYVPAQNALEASLFAEPSLAGEREYTF
jgi:hypothetical protein